MICLSRGRPGDAQTSPALREAAHCPSQPSALHCGWTERNAVTVVLPSGRHLPSFPLLSGDTPTSLVMERMSERLVKRVTSTMGNFYKVMARAQRSQLAVTCSASQRTLNTP